MLQMLERFDLREMGYGSPDALMAQIEAKRLAFVDRARGYADPAFSGLNPNVFIQPTYAQLRSLKINLETPNPSPYQSALDDHMDAAYLDSIANEESRLLRQLNTTADLKDEFTRALAALEVPSEAATTEEKARYETEKEWLQSQIESFEGELRAVDKKLQDGDTTYLTVTDKDGMMVSLIQSNYRGMGSGLVPDGLGFMFQDRGQLFSLDPEHPNVFEPGKRPFHTIIPAFAYKKDMPSCQVRAVAAEEACPYEPWLSFGLMGGGMQPQGHVQIILNLIDFDMGLQEAGDAARWEHRGGCEPTDDLSGDDCEADIGTVHLESGIPVESREELERRGHTVTCCRANGGGYQAIMRDFETGAWIAATEMRKDGSADGY